MQYHYTQILILTC